jgi:hypothetical protein
VLGSRTPGFQLEQDMTITVLHHDDRNSPQLAVEVNLRRYQVHDPITLKRAIKDAVGDFWERDVLRVWQATRSLNGNIKRSIDVANMSAIDFNEAIRSSSKDGVPFLWYDELTSPRSSPISLSEG